MNVIIHKDITCEKIKELYMNNKELMDYTYISKKRFNKIITGKVLPSLRNLIAISNVYKVKIDNLIYLLLKNGIMNLSITSSGSVCVVS